MRLVFVRHSLSMDKKDFASSGKLDRDRPLTGKGLKDINKVGRILKKSIVTKVNMICSSPYLRALQTAKVLGKIYKKSIHKKDFLCPEGDFIEMLAFIRKQPDNITLVMVGHNPSMGNIIGRILVNRSLPIVNLDKSGVAIVDLEKRGSKIIDAKLIWVLQPELLIKICFD